MSTFFFQNRSVYMHWFIIARVRELEGRETRLTISAVCVVYSGQDILEAAVACVERGESCLSGVSRRRR